MLTYKETHTTRMTDGFSQVLKETFDSFNSQRISMLGDGFKEILAEDVIFEDYKDKLAAGLEANDAVILESLFDNTRLNILQENSTSGIQPVSSLTFPMLRKAWPRTAITNTVPTEPVKLPKFSVTYYEPYVMDPAGNKLALPTAMLTPGNNIDGRQALTLAAPIAVPSNAFDLFGAVGASKLIGDGIDVDFFVTQVTMTVLNAAAAVPQSITAAVRFKVDTSTGTLTGEVSGTHSDGTVTTDILFGKLDRYNGTLTVTSVGGAIQDVTVEGYLTTEYHNTVEEVGFDVTFRDIDVGQGKHLSSPLPIDFLNDTMALYNIDGAAKVVDIMSDVLAQRIDLEGIGFLKQIHLDNGTDPVAVQYAASFNTFPSAAFTGSPTEWRNELRTVVDHVAIRMKNDSNFSNGYFSIIGNQLDTALLNNVDWSFNGASDERGGVEVAYSLGAMSGAANYKITASSNYAPGSLNMTFIPSNEEQNTVKFYPYSFYIDRDNLLRSPNKPNVPSISLTRRYTFEKFTPLVAEIAISNNTGALPA